MRELIARVRDWLRRDELDAELSEELRFHREHLERDARLEDGAAGAAPDIARRRLGNVTRVHEEARDRWSVPWLDHLLQDARYAARGLRRSPSFTATVVLTLGLGIGANVAMFNMIDELMFRPYPFLRDPAMVHRVYLQTTSRAGQSTITMFPYARYLDLRRWSTSFSDFAVFTAGRHGVGTGESARDRTVLGVSAGFFGFFDARPALGRYFTPAQDTIGDGAKVVVISHAFWQSELGGRDVIGEPLLVGNVAYEIVGVAPKGFVGVAEDEAPAVFVPITAYAQNQGGSNRENYYLQYTWDWAQVMVRRKPGISRETADADLTNAFRRSWTAARAINPRYRSTEAANPRAVAGAMKTAAGPVPSLEAKTLLWVSGVSLTVLLIACANVANLYLTRALRRRREMALRIALGVSRARLTAQALTESILLSVLGCAAGLVVAQWGGAILRQLFLAERAPLVLITDWRTLGMALVAALVVALVTGVAPVFFAGRTDVIATLKAGAREGTYQRSGARSTLLVVQGALCVVLLVGAGLFVRSFANVSTMSLGYDADPILLVEWERRGTPMDSAARAALRDRLLATARAQPDVISAAWTNSAPFSSGTSTFLLAVPGVDSVGLLGRFTFQIAGAGYFETMGTRIVRGRAFSAADRAGSPRVTIVSEAIASTLWPDRNPLGQCMRISIDNKPPGTHSCTTVIGVAENAVHSPTTDYPMRYYLPESQLDFGATWLLLRMRRDPAVAAEETRLALQAVMPGQSHVAARPARDMVSAKNRSWQLGATTFAGFGLLALVVAAIGLYGVIAYNVAQRMHELGVRMALGARGIDVARLVVGQGVRMGLSGVAVGSAIALGAGRWIQPLLFRESARDPVVFALVALTLVLVAIVASAVPAVRAIRADPNTVLRAD